MLVGRIWFVVWSKASVFQIENTHVNRAIGVVWFSINVVIGVIYGIGVAARKVRS